MASMTRDHALALVVPAAVVAAAMLLAPHLHVSPGAADALTFGGAAAVSILGLVLGTRAPLSPRGVVAIDAFAAATLGVLAALRVRSPWIAPVVDASLLAVAWATGGAIGARIEHPGHLLPAAAVAAAADVASVTSSSGPTHAIAASERALAVLAVSFPVPGTGAVAPALGVGDLVFVALLLAAARAHGLSVLRVAGLSLAGILLAGFGSALSGRAFPALPAIGAVVVGFVPEARRLRRKDRTVATLSIGVAAVVAAYGIVNALRVP
jgi:hypothetical protein